MSDFLERRKSKPISPVMKDAVGGLPFSMDDAAGDANTGDVSTAGAVIIKTRKVAKKKLPAVSSDEWDDFLW